MAGLWKFEAIGGAALAVAIGLAVGCGRAHADAPDASETPRVSAENAVAFSLAKHHLSAVRADLAAGADPSMHCKTLLPLLPQLVGEDDASVKKLTSDAAQTCGYDAPLAWGRANLALLDGGGSNAAPCVHLEGALDELRGSGHAGEVAVRELDAAYRRYCASGG
jgi:hypothetical protein